MDEIVSLLIGCVGAFFFYFLWFPTVVSVFALVFNCVPCFCGKKGKTFSFFVWSDLGVAVFCFPFWALCTVLPGVATKSVANFSEIRIIGYIWGAFLLVRLLLYCLSVRNYRCCARLGNVLVFIICILFAYLFPTLPE